MLGHTLKLPFLMLILMFLSTPAHSQEINDWQYIVLANASEIRQLNQFDTRQDDMPSTYIVIQVVLSANGNRLVIQYGDTAASPIENLIQLWDVNLGTLIAEFHYDQTQLQTIFSPDEQLLVTLDENALHVVNAITGEKLKDREEGQIPSNSVKFSSDGSLLAFADLANKEIVFWNILDDVEFSYPSQSNVEVLAFNPHRSEFAFGNHDGEIYLCEIIENSINNCRLLFKGDQPFFNLMFDWSGNTLVFDGLPIITIVNVEDSSNLRFMPDAWINRLLLERPSGDVIGTMVDNEIQLVRLSTGEKLASLEGGEYLNDVDRNETIYATTQIYADPSTIAVQLRNIVNSEPLAEFNLTSSFIGRNLFLKFSPDNRYIVVVRSDGFIQFWGINDT